jgi:hypothetical protein
LAVTKNHKTMKNYFLILLIVFSVKVYGQYDYIPIDFNHSGWNYVGYIIGDNMYPEYIDLYKCKFENDTSINTYQYHKFHFEKHRWHYDEYGSSNYLGFTDGYAGAIREAGFKYFYVPKDSLSEILLYDFEDLSIGDTIWEDIAANDILVIDSIHLDTLDDNSIRKSYSGLQYGYKRVNLIEGIGLISNINGGLIPPEFVNVNLIDYDGGFNIEGYCENGNCVIYEGNFSGAQDCGFTLDVESELKIEISVKIRPNPFNEYIYLEHAKFDINKKLEISVFSLIGQEILNLRVDNNSKIDLSDIKRGAYLIRIKGVNNEYIGSKLLIKE